jgi:hypothetical protein
MGLNSPKDGVPGVTDQSTSKDMDANSDPEVKRVSDPFKTSEA